MLFKVNPTKQNIQTEQGALVVTGNCYVQLHTPLTDMRRFKVLIKQKGEKGGKPNKKHEWSLCERPVIKLLGTSLHRKRHTHTRTQSHQCSLHSHAHTQSDYWAVAVTPLMEQISVSEEKYNICRPRERVLGRGGKQSTARDHTGNMCVNGWPVYHVTRPSHTYTTTDHNARYNTEKHSTLSALFWCTLWQCLLNVMCKK